MPKKYQNTSWLDKVIAIIQWCSFFNRTVYVLTSRDKAHIARCRLAINVTFCNSWHQRTMAVVFINGQRSDRSYNDAGLMLKKIILLFSRRLVQ